MRVESVVDPTLRPKLLVPLPALSRIGSRRVTMIREQGC
jgi:hypothetical protein